MKKHLPKYYPLVLGAVITFFITVILEAQDLIIIRPEINQENILIFAFWWLTISLIVFQFNKVKRKWFLVRHLLVLLSLLIVTIFIDNKMGLPDNPLTITLLLFFWLYLFYILAKPFFNRYRLLIIGVYVFDLLLFYYLKYSYASINEFRGILTFCFFSPILLFAMLWVYEQWRWVKQIKSERTKSELDLLKNQINPHFFFNTLNNLYGLAIEKSDETPAMILKLSDIMRYSIYEGKKEAVLLNDEINYMNNFIELHSIRFHEKIEISFEKEIDQDYKIAPLLFINLLENAFKHGAETMTNGAFIRMKLIANRHFIDFSITNNYEDVNGRSETQKGIGIQNLQKRLALIYPDAHKLKFQKDNSTFKATLHIHLES